MRRKCFHCKEDKNFRYFSNIGKHQFRTASNLVCTGCNDNIKNQKQQLSACEVKGEICYPQTRIVCVENLIRHCESIVKGLDNQTNDPKGDYKRYLDNVNILRTALEMCVFAPKDDMYKTAIHAFMNDIPKQINMRSGNPGNVILWKYEVKNINTYIRAARCTHIEKKIVDSEGDISVHKLKDWCKSLELEILKTKGLYVHQQYEKERKTVAGFVSKKSSSEMKEELGGILNFLDQDAEEMYTKRYGVDIHIGYKFRPLEEFLKTDILLH